jgi:phospholipid/cholesterol/gamma-HCH transport system substrate-binding protein
MPSKNIELKVGLLVLIGAAILVFAVWLAKGYRYGQEFYSVSVMFPEVGALATGDPVAVSGVNKGKVKSLGLYKGGVMVELDISSDVILMEDASFVVKNIGLMGERFVAVKTGTSDKKLDLTQFTNGTFDAGIPEVMGMMGGVIKNMNDLVDLLEKTVISPATLDKFSQTITSMQKIAERIESLSEKNVPQIDSAIGNFTRVAEGIKNGIDRNQPYIDTAAQNFDVASRKLMQVLEGLEEASNRLKAFAVDLDESEGTMRMLMEDRRLYDDLRRSTQNLDSLVNDIRENPKKYINFTVEIF